jgi:hypothetical protein
VAIWPSDIAAGPPLPRDVMTDPLAARSAAFWSRGRRIATPELVEDHF